MAEVIPFHGILYNPEKIDNMATVVAPPYDVIDADQQKTLCDRHPNNIIRLILGEPGENTGDSQVFYQAAADRFRSWLADNILLKDGDPAFYFTSVEFTLDGKDFLRYGLIGYVRLEPFEKRVVLPHERTSSKVKADRLNLIKTTCANFCQIFSLYPDPGKTVLGTLTDAVRDRQPDIDVTDNVGERHKLWRITDPVITETVSRAMADKQLFIADGHHRYETALNYKAWVAANDPDFSEDHPANYLMMYMSALSDPGLVILPTHRMLPELDPDRLSVFTEKAQNYFDIQTIPCSAGGTPAEKDECLSSLCLDTTRNTIGMAINGRPEFYLLTPKPDKIQQLFGQSVPEVLRGLDVTVLARLVLIELLGFTQAELDEEKAICYTSNAEEALDAAFSGESDVSFLLNATKKEQVCAVAENGEIMPRKSTFYYPKVLSGLVLSSNSR